MSYDRKRVVHTVSTAVASGVEADVLSLERGFSK
jgi:hypothetical protein